MTKPLPRPIAILLALVLAVLAAVAGSTLIGAAPAHAAVRTHTITGYWQNFDNGAKNLKLRDVPDAYGIVAVAFADAVPNTPGAISFTLDATLSSRLGGYTAANLKSDIQTLHSQGRQVVLSVGGQNGAISLPDAAAASAFANSSYSLMQQYGFDGVDIDLENAPNLENMTSALRQLKAKVGSSFVLTMAPETIYVQEGGSYLKLIDQVKDIITVVNTQYYNSGSMLGRDGRAYSSGTVDFFTALADILLNGHLRADQVGLGAPATPQAAGSGYVSPSVVNAALDCLAAGTNCGTYHPAAKYPSIRGAMTWSVNWDGTGGNQFATVVGGHLGSIGTPSSGGGTTPPPSGASCSGVGAWSSSTVYTGGQKATYRGTLFTAKWWTQGETPGAADVWLSNGACS